MSAAATDRLRVRDVTVVAAGAALFAAVGNTLVVLLQQHVFNRASSASADFALLAPIGYLTVFAVIAVPLLALAFLLPSRIGRHFIPGMLAATASFALLALIPRVHAVALLIVAVAIGARVGIAFGQQPARALTATRWVAGLSGVAMVLIAGSTLTLRRLNGWQLDRARVAANANAPNIVMLILDTVRAKNLSVYGYPRPTSPVIARLAAAGVAFEQAYSTATFSAPSHASMMMGLYASQTGANYTSRVRGKPPTLAEALNAHGYMTGAFVANSVWAGRNVGIGRGFSHYLDFPFNFEQALWCTTLTQSRSGRRLIGGVRSRDLWRIAAAIRRPDLRFQNYQEAHYSTPEIIRRFWGWRDTFGAKPYFAMVNVMDAHAPYVSPKKFQNMFGSGTKLDRYDGAIAYLDSIVGGIVEALRLRKELDRTVIVVLADHGELFGEHGLHEHTPSVYRNATHVPLIFSGGAVPRGVRVSAPVSLRDLAATLLDIAGVSEHSLPGTSLRHMWQPGSSNAASPVIFEVPQGKNVGVHDLSRIGAIKGAADSTWYYIRYADAREEIFQWRTDSLETTNLVTTTEGRAAADRLLEILKRELGDVSPGGQVAGDGKR